MKNTILIAALLLAGTSAQALTDAEFNRIIDQTQRDQDRNIASQERYIRESNDGYDRLQREFDRETIRNNRLGQEAERQYIEQRRRERKGY